MQKFPLWIKLGVSEETERKSDKLMNEGEKLKAEGINVRKKADGMNQELWEAHERFRFAQVVEDHHIGQFYEKLMEVKNRKKAILGAHQRLIDRNRVEHEEVLKPVKADAEKLLDAETERMGERYVCALPVARPHPHNPDRELGPVRVHLDSLEKFLDISTNADSILKGKEAIVATKALLRDVSCVKELRKILESLENELSKLDFNPKEITIKAFDYERINTAIPAEVSYLVRR